MSRIKYIDSVTFFAKEYRDGIIVAFADISGDKLLIANQIHKIISSNIGNELFVSDIVKLLDVNDLCKHKIQNSLCVFNKQGVSISACGIQTTFYKDLVHVIFERCKVLIIKRRKTRKLLKCLFLVVAIICICNLLIPEEDINDITYELEISSDTETDIITNNATTLPININNDCISTTSNDESETAAVVDIDSSLTKNEAVNKCWEDSVAVSDNSSTIVDEIIENKGHMLEVNNAPVIPNDFVLIPEGTLYKYEDDYDNEQQKYIYKNIHLDAFYVCKHEVTQEEYERIMGTNPSQIKGPKLPVNTVQFIDAINYCNARSIAEGYDGFYTISGNVVSVNPSSNGYRLPNEYEWAFASRNDEKTKTKYAGGNNIKDIAWYGGNSNCTLHQVCTKSPNQRGVYDMNGNVSEWLWKKEFNRYNCQIGSDFMTYISFGESDVVGSSYCSEENGFRVILITKEQRNSNINNIQTVKHYIKEKFSSVEHKKKQDRENAEKERQTKALKTEANGYIGQAVALYKEYCANQDLRKMKAVVSLLDKAIQIDSAHYLFFTHKRAALKQCQQLFEAIINGQTYPFSARVQDKTEYRIGDYYNKNGKEGIVYKVTSGGLHGKIISLAQSNNPLQWCVDENKVGNLLDYDGASNMKIIQSIEGWYNKFPAFAWCSDLGEGWYLPSLYELYNIFYNDEVRNTLVSYLLEYNPHWYLEKWDGDLWTSTEGDEFAYQALYISFDDKCGRWTNKKYTNYVRAVTEF